MACVRKTHEQNEERTVATGQHGAFHLSMDDDQLLAEDSIFYNKIGAAVIQVETTPEITDRVAGIAQWFKRCLN